MLGCGLGCAALVEFREMLLLFFLSKCTLDEIEVRDE